ncbi:hypothetical protein INR49_000008 [Caranx melampygus]|nr:hypothetical protein INR49_000008 [Caranx melampygus]
MTAELRWIFLLLHFTVTEQKVGDDDDDEVTLKCSVRSYDGHCGHSVQWLFDDEDKNKETSQFSCSDSVKIQTSEFNQKMKSLRCKVTDHHGNKKLFEFKTQKSTGAWWVYLLVGVASVFLVLVVVWFFIRQKKKKTPEIEPETHQNQADPEGIAYISVSFTKTTRNRDQFLSFNTSLWFSAVDGVSEETHTVLRSCHHRKDDVIVQEVTSKVTECGQDHGLDQGWTGLDRAGPGLDQD